jgi:lysophospholipase L1-like esterase
MKKHSCLILMTVAAIALANSLPAQSNSTAATNAPVAAAVHTNTAIVPVPRPDERSRARTDIVLKRAKDNPGPCDIAFIGDSITQGWEGAGGKPVWEKYYGNRKCLNFGVGGDRTQHVLWRFDHGQLDGIKPKVAVVMIGTNNSNKDDNSEAEILEGVTAIISQIRERLPDTKIILNAIFPRGKTFSTQRGKILQVNQALERLADNKNIFWIDCGSKMIENDGSISTDMMRDALHPGEKGYVIWAEANESLIKQLLK